MKRKKRFKVTPIISAVVLVAILAGIIGVSGFMIKSDPYNDYDIAKIVNSIDTNRISVEVMDKTEHIDMKNVIKDYTNAVMLRMKSGYKFPSYLSPDKVVVDKYDNTILLYSDSEIYSADHENLINDNRAIFAKTIQLNDIVLEDTKISADNNEAVLSYAADVMNTRDKANELLRKNVKGKITIGIVDTGLYSENSVVAKYFNKSECYDFVNNDNNTFDKCDTHASEVSSLIVDLIGEELVEKSIQFVNAKCLENGTGSSVNMYYSILYLVDKGVDIINISAGGLGETDKMMEYAIKVANDAGIIVVCSSGNDGIDVSAGQKHFPSSCQYAISVSSVDERMNFSSFANYGDVDFTAPGENILVNSVEGGKAVVSGTSFSAPAVAATLALAKLEDDTICNKEASLKYLKNICVDLGSSGFDKYYGHGLPVFDVEPVEEPTTEEPTTKPVESPTEEPTTKPVESPTEEPTTKPVERPTEEPTTEEPTTKPVERPTEEPTTEEPTTKPVERPTEEPTTKPVEKPTEEPTTEEPTEIPTEKPTIDKVENIAYKGYSSHSMYTQDGHLYLYNAGEGVVPSKVFTFDAVKNARYYEIWYADYNGEKSYDALNWYKKVETYWNGYQDNDLKMGTDILIKVRAVDSEGNKGEFSEVYEIRLIDFNQISKSKNVNSDAGIYTWSDCNNRFSFFRCLLYTNNPDGGYTLVEDSGKLYGTNTYKFNKVGTVSYHKVKLLCYYEVVLNGEVQTISIGDDFSVSWRVFW